MAIYKTREGAQRHCRPGYAIRQIGADFEVYKLRSATRENMTHSERLVASLRHHTERQTRALTAVGGRPDYSALRDAGQCIANLRATMTPEEIAAALA